MKIHSFLLAGSLFLASFSTGQAQNNSEYMEDIQEADQQFLLENFSRAESLYNDAKSHASSASEKSYVHYKLGTVYLRLNDKVRARQEWRSGLEVLEQDGGNAAIQLHLKQALRNNGL
ncbi:hypothetical protein [Emcibacter sp.]|uniref:hypothetical protein n=1 Tax=Emcibacter sp. TaxID=1979954 RepID=UPI003A8E66D4